MAAHMLTAINQVENREASPESFWNGVLYAPFGSQVLLVESLHITQALHDGQVPDMAQFFTALNEIKARLQPIFEILGKPKTYEEWQEREAVLRPGKFEGEAYYVPFFYKETLDGCEDEIVYAAGVPVSIFVISEEHVKCYPDIGEEGEVICFYQDDQGFFLEGDRDACKALHDEANDF